MFKDKTKVPSAEAAKELTGVEFSPEKVTVQIGDDLYYDGWLSVCGNLFVRELDGSRCCKEKFSIVNN